MTQKKYFASMTLNDTKIDLGFATFEIILQRIVSKQRSFSDLIETGQVYFAATKEGLATKESNPNPAKSAKTENEKFLDELHERFPETRDYIVQATDDMESPIPGMLLKDYIAAGSSKEYKDYAFFATNPDKRIGVPAGQIEEAKRVYEEKYPLMAKHCPKWI